jgi:Tfp pilus assembly protein PilF
LSSLFRRNPTFTGSRKPLNKYDQTQALHELEQAVKLEPKHLGAYYQLGLLYGRSGQKEKSREAFRIQRQLTEQLHQGIIAVRMP